MYELTIFKSQFDNKTHRRMQFPDWDRFIDLLRNLSKVSRSGKRDAQLISPAVYQEGTTRANKNVAYWGKWAAVDVDDYDGSIFALHTRFSEYNFCIYSTASSTVKKPKFRIVFDLSRIVEGDEVKHFWFALNKYLDELGDPQTKDSSRMYYVPAKYEGAHNFFEVNYGKPIDVDYLKAKYEYTEPKGNSFLDRLPPEMQKAVIEHRKSKLENTSYHWSGYSDCPFFPKKLAARYQSITDTGWYHTMYCIMVAIASNAIKKQYPITANEIATLCKQFDQDNGNWYEKRPMHVEANSALEYAYRNAEWC